ncbi:hypothetical protein BHE74_00040905 [Ensete ventricosum]|nr:hypothetical protein BHE74_00040905 [Ensete ventricosum]
MRAPDMPHTASNRGRLPATPDLALKFRKQQGSPGPRRRGQYLRVLRRYPQHLPLFVRQEPLLRRCHLPRHPAYLEQRTNHKYSSNENPSQSIKKESAPPAKSTFGGGGNRSFQEEREEIDFEKTGVFAVVLIETGAASESKSEEMWIYREALPDCDYTSGKGEGSGRLTRGAFSFAAPRNVRVLLPEVSN